MWASALALAALAWPAHAGSATASGSASGSGRFCDRAQPLTADEQDRLLRFAAVVRDTLDAQGGDTALVSRSGLDLSRFRLRYSHAAVALRGAAAEPADAAAAATATRWSARQLYYACDERRPRLYDQGLAGFTMGTDDASLGYVSIVILPPEAALPLRQAALDAPRALHLLAARYSANAYAFSLRYQNCNQWLAELLAVAWGDLPDGDDLRPRAQQWLRHDAYAPTPVAIDSHGLVLAALFVPLVHLDDHPASARRAMTLQISLPASLEAYAHQRYPDSRRIELCHDGREVVVHEGWTPIADGCQAGPGDRVLRLD